MNQKPLPSKPKTLLRRYRWPVLVTLGFVGLALGDFLLLSAEDRIAKAFFSHPTIQALGWLATVFGLGYAIVQIAESASKLEAVAAATRTAKSSNHQQLLFDSGKLLKFAQTSINAQNISVANGLLLIVIQRLQSIRWETISMGLTYNTNLADVIATIEKVQTKIVAAGSLGNPNEIDDRFQEASTALNGAPEILNSIGETAVGSAAK